MASFRSMLTARPGNAFNISFVSDIADLKSRLRDRERRQLPFALMLALNDTMKAVRLAEQREIARAFDRPTKLTRNSVLYREATKQRLVAEIFIRGRDDFGKGTPPAEFLAPQHRGGIRKPKPFEKALRRKGLLGSDEYAVPAKGFPLDTFGNIKGSRLEAMLSQLQAAEMTAGFMANETERSGRRNRRAGKARYFIADGTGRLPRGIFERSGATIRAMLIFVKGAPSYAERFHFEKVGVAEARRVFGPHFKERFLKAIATAR